MNPETKEKLIAWATTAKETALSAGKRCKDTAIATWKSGRKGKAVCIGVAAAVLLVSLKCGGGGGDSGQDGKGGGGRTKSPAALLKKAEKAAAESGNINFFGFYTGMPANDAEALARHYGFSRFGEEAWKYEAAPITHEVYDIKIGLPAVQSLTKGGNTYDELVQAVVNVVGTMEFRGDDKYRRQTLGGVTAYMRPPQYVWPPNGQKDSGWFELEDNGLEQKARLQEEEMKKREAAAAWEATRASVDSINRELRKNDSHRPGETKTITLPGGAKMEMAWCPPGAFMMGSPNEDAENAESEVEHRVTLTEGFWMAKTEVTQAQWAKVMGNNPAKQDKGDDMPAVNVSWLDSRFFCERSGLALPSETQWEYACRAGSTGAYSGTGKLDDMGWHAGNSGEKLHPVAKKKANAWGLYDMHGNVAEWCADSATKFSNDSVTNPPVRESGDTRVVRGGGYRFPAEYCRSASWSVLDVKKAGGLLGLRPICVDLEAQKEMTKKTDRLRMELEALGRGTQAGETKTIHLFDGTPMEMAWCPPGSFTMGAGVRGSEHQVTLTTGFWLAKTEVSQAQWKDVMGFNPAETPHGGLSIDKPTGIPGDDLPVVGISWEWCRQFCLKTGLKLPTEAQWEYACGAGNWRMENASYGDFVNTGWYNMASSWAKVDAGAANAWGFRNMMENVAEWCADWFTYPMGRESATDPAGSDTGEKRVVRTGSYGKTVRIGLEPAQAYNCLGFRPCYP